MQIQPPSRNALKHGCCALDTLILPAENVEDFRALEKSLRDAYETPTEWELDLLNHAIQAEWFHIRATKAYAQFEFSLYRSVPDPSEWTDAQHRNLARFLRYKTKHANDVAAHLKRLQAFKKVRPVPKKEPEPPPSLLQKQRAEKLAYLDILAQDGLVRWQDLDGVFDTGSTPLKP